jgi:hypothetical protein
LYAYLAAHALPVPAFVCGGGGTGRISVRTHFHLCRAGDASEQTDGRATGRAIGRAILYSPYKPYTHVMSVVRTPLCSYYAYSPQALLTHSAGSQIPWQHAQERPKAMLVCSIRWMAHP